MYKFDAGSLGDFTCFVKNNIIYEHRSILKQMDKRIEKIKEFRKFLLAQIAWLTTEQLNKIPEGYNNNIIWNVAHLICAQQSICYIRAAQPVTVDDKYISPYMTRTKPNDFIDADEIETIKQLLLTPIDQLQTDLDKKIFDSYTASENIFKIYGVQLNDIGDALEFILYHDGFHSGYIISLMHLVVDSRKAKRTF